MAQLLIATKVARANAVCIFAGICALFPPVFVGAAGLADRPGFVVEKPAEAPHVAVDGGFMVPYTATIPGTDVTFEMVPVPGGTFLQGSPDSEADRNPDEGPQVEANVPPFWIGKCEVTWAEYKVYMQLCSAFEKFEDQKVREVNRENEIDAVTAPSKVYDPGFTFSGGEDPGQPAVSMSQFAAKQYTKWLSLLTEQFYRLPSESEWEYACRAGSTTAYYFGDDPVELDEFAWYYDNADDRTHPVGLKQPNAWGLYDMHGNACEWTLDQYDPEWYGKLAGKPVPIEEALNWPERLYPRVLRGGSWNLDPQDCRSAARRGSDDDEMRVHDPNVPQSPWWFASDSAQDIGFRIVRPLADIPREEREKYWEADLESISRVVNQRITEEGRGERGLVDPHLPNAIEELEQKKKVTR